MTDQEKLDSIYNEVVGLILKSDFEVTKSHEDIRIATDQFTLTVYLHGILFGYTLSYNDDNRLYIQSDTDNYQGSSAINDTLDKVDEIKLILTCLKKSLIQCVYRKKRTLFRLKEVPYFIIDAASEDFLEIQVPAVNNYSLGGKG